MPVVETGVSPPEGFSGQPGNEPGPTPAASTGRVDRELQRAKEYGESKFQQMLKLARAVGSADPESVESFTVRLGKSKRWLAPVAWAAGTVVLMLRGIKLLLLNWRLLLLQLIPAVWIWFATWDLRQHALRGVPFRDLDTGGVLVLTGLCILMSTGAFWCNVAFAYAIEDNPPLVRPAMQQATQHLRQIAMAGLVIGGILGFAAAWVPQHSANELVFTVAMGGSIGLMFLSFVAVPGHILGRRQEKLPPRQYIGRTAAGWVLSGIAMAPGFVLNRVGFVMLGIPGLRVGGIVILSLGAALYAAGMSSVKAVTLSSRLGLGGAGGQSSDVGGVSEPRSIS